MDFEFTLYTGSMDMYATQPLLQYDCVRSVFNNAGAWFSCMVALPYDSTFRLDALLDCLVFLMGDEYGKF